MEDPFLWLAILLTLASLYFGAATVALRNLSRGRLEDVLERRGRRDRLEGLADRAPELMLSASILRLIANLGLILVTIVLFRDRIHNVYAQYATVLAVAGGVLLVFGVGIPNAWSKYAGEELIAATYPFLTVCRIVLKPVTGVLHLTDEIVRRLVDVPGQDEAEQIEQEILETVNGGARRGAVDTTERQMIEPVIELRDTLVGQIMTPRIEVVALDVDAGVTEARQLIVKEGHSRIPLYHKTIDHIVGVLYAKDLLRIEGGSKTDLRSLMRKVPFVPENKSLRDLLREFQENKVQLAVVIDEDGGTAGLVTVEDIMLAIDADDRRTNHLRISANLTELPEKAGGDVSTGE